MATGNGSWQLISMVPMVALLFMKAPRPQRGPGPSGITCPRCEADHPHGRYYCTSCGWELTKAYPAEGAIAEETPRVATHLGQVEHRKKKLCIILLKEIAVMPLSIPRGSP